MRKTIATTFLLGCFVFVSFAQDTTSAKKPLATYLVGAAKITVWENTGKHGNWKNFKVEKTYQRGDQTVTTNSFNEKELLDLREAIDKAIAEQKTSVPEEKK